MFRWTAILAGLLFAGVMIRLAAEDTVTATVLGPARTPAEVVSRFATAGLDREDAADDCCRDRDATRMLAVHLVTAGPATRRQALAHALGCWWTFPPGSPGKILLSRSSALPTAKRSASVLPTGLHGRPGLVAIVRSAMAPWLGGDGAISADQDSGQWSASLDADGHARLVELLSILQRPEPVVPPLVSSPDGAGAGRDSPDPVQATTWGGLTAALATAYHITTALDGAVAPETRCHVSLPAGRLSAIPMRLATQGINAALIRGALCLGRVPPSDREHPATSRRLAVLPLAHLATRRGDDALIASLLLRRVDPAAWSLPGWTIIPLEDPRCLVVAANTTTIHRVIAALAEIEHGGIDGFRLVQPIPVQTTSANP